MIVAEVGRLLHHSLPLTVDFIHAREGKKCMNGPFSHDFLSSRSGSDINDLFEGKATLKYFK